MGREAAGVRGIKLGDGQELIALIVVGEGNILTASATGYGKLTPLEEFPSHGRGGQGVIAAANLGSQWHDRGGVTGGCRSGNHADQLDRHARSNNGGRNIGFSGATRKACGSSGSLEGERLTGIERIEHLEGEGVDEPASGTSARHPRPMQRRRPESPPDSEN